jgi:hypothetical protein
MDNKAAGLNRPGGGFRQIWSAYFLVGLLPGLAGFCFLSPMATAPCAKRGGPVPRPAWRIPRSQRSKSHDFDTGIVENVCRRLHEQRFARFAPQEFADLQNDHRKQAIQRRTKALQKFAGQ